MPPQVHIHISSECNTPITVGLEGTQGASTAGTQGTGVKTPNLAAVAAATAGFVIVKHLPNGLIFTIGVKSLMSAIGKFDAKTRDLGTTDNADGMVPNEHLHIAPLTTTGIFTRNHTLRWKV